MSHLDSGLIHELLDGEIPSSQLAPIQTHLAACAECRTKLAEERALVDGTDDLIALLEVPASAPAAAVDRIARPRRAGWARNLAWAATVVLAAGLGYAGRGRPETTILHDTITVAVKPDIASDRPSPPADITPPAIHARPPISAGTTQRLAAPTVAEPVHVAAADKAAAPAPSPTVVSNVTGQRVDSVAARADQNARGGAPVSAISPVNVPRDTVGTLAMAGQSAASKSPLNDSSARADAARDALPAARIVGGGGGGRGGRGGGRGAPLDTISLADAIKHLGGKILRIDSMVPLRYQFREPNVYVFYPGEIVLRQQVIDGVLQFWLTAPPTLPADSLAKLRARVHE